MDDIDIQKLARELGISLKDALEAVALVDDLKESPVKPKDKAAKL